MRDYVISCDDIIAKHHVNYSDKVVIAVFVSFTQFNSNVTQSVYGTVDNPVCGVCGPKYKSF